MSRRHAPLSHFAALVLDVHRSAGRRFAAVAALAVMAAAAQGVGLLLLLPLLDLLGVTGGPEGGMPAMRAVGRHLGLGGALALYLVLMAGATGVVWVHTVAAAALTQDYLEDLRARLYRAVLAMGWPDLSRRRQADLTHAVAVEADRCGFAVNQLLQLLAAALQLPALLAAAFVLSPGFTAAALLLAAGLALAVRPLSIRAYGLGVALGEARRILHAELADQMAGLRQIKAMGIEERHGAAVARMAAGVQAKVLAQTRAGATARAAQRVAAAIAAALAVWTGVRELNLPLADMLVLLVLFARLVPAALRVQECWRMILQQLPIHARLLTELGAWTRAAEPAPAPAAPALADAIELRGLGYAYPSQEGPQDGRRAAVRGIDARLPAFATTALVGPSGSGKSTLADLAIGLIPPTEGAVLIDGVALDGPARAAWRQRVGYVPQDPFLFHMPIRENLLLARPEATEEDLWQALEQAAVADVVRDLPRGLDTPVGDRGAQLSGGERQRIVLARALLRRPALLVLDEATASLDTETERLVAETLRRLQGTMTVLVVAHRPSTVRAADHVLVLEAGRLLASGSWQDVRAAAGDRLAALGMGG